MASVTVVDRNPSPPPEILENDEDFMPDRIGNSMYSKRWLYKTLMKMLEVVKEYTNEEKKPTVKEDLIKTAKETEQSTSEVQNIIELDAKIEEDACTLWDMSANSEVADFLCECNVAEIFLTIIEHTKSPRLLEIVMGILGNMSSFNSTCEYMSKNKALMHSIIALSGCTDSCSLVQLFRLLNCCIAKENCQKEWFDAFEEHSFFMENLKSILQNNLCHDVLRGLLEVLDRILNDSSAFFSMWGQEPYVIAIIESGKQLMKCNHHGDLDAFFSVVNTLCQNSSGVSVYALHFEVLRPLFHGYFIKLGDEETLPQVVRVTIISSAFAVYGNLLYSKNINSEHLVFDTSVFKAMLNISKLVNILLSNLTKSLDNQDFARKEGEDAATSITKTEEQNGASSEETIEEDIESWTILLEAIVYAAKACLFHAEQESDIQILEDIINLNVPENEGGAGT